MLKIRGIHYTSPRRFGLFEGMLEDLDRNALSVFDGSAEGRLLFVGVVAAGLIERTKAPGGLFLRVRVFHFYDKL